MKVEHIIWEYWCYGTDVSGLIEFKMFWHGGGENTIIVQGTYNHQTDTIRTPFGNICPDDITGCSGISIIKVGTIV